MKKTLANMLDSDKNLDLTKIKVKTDILWGELDKITPPRQARKMHDSIKGSHLKIFPNWTHAPYICDPEGLARAISQVMKDKK